jgi:hypothetical protein
MKNYFPVYGRMLNSTTGGRRKKRHVQFKKIDTRWRHSASFLQVGLFLILSPLCLVTTLMDLLWLYKTRFNFPVLFLIYLILSLWLQKSMLEVMELRFILIFIFIAPYRLITFIWLLQYFSYHSSMSLIKFSFLVFHCLIFNLLEITF